MYTVLLYCYKTIYNNIILCCIVYLLCSAFAVYITTSKFDRIPRRFVGRYILYVYRVYFIKKKDLPLKKIIKVPFVKTATVRALQCPSIES